MITLAQAETFLARYKGSGNDFTERLNLTCERLIKSGSWRSTKDTVVFNVYRDEAERSFITLPRLYNTIMAGVALNWRNQGDSDFFRRCGVPTPVQTEWYSFLTSGPGFTDNPRFTWGQGFIPEVDRFTTFRNWYEPKYLRLKFDAAEANGLVFNIRGKYDGEIIYTGAGQNTIEGENLTTNGGTLTTTSQFSEIPYALVKPATYGQVKMYTWDGSEEVHVATYAPTETVPQWRRYRIPACDQWTEDDPGHYLTVLNREWQPISNDNDFVIPGNIGALRFGLQALLKEDAEDYARAQELWGMADKLLANEAEMDTGAGANVQVQVADSFLLNTGTMGGNSYDTYGYGW